MTEPFFTEIERQSAVWKKLKTRLEARRDLLRRQNDGNLSHDQTMKLRGRIAEVNNLLALGENQPTQPEESEFKD